MSSHIFLTLSHGWVAAVLDTPPRIPEDQWRKYHWHRFWIHR